MDGNPSLSSAPPAPAETPHAGPSSQPYSELTLNSPPPAPTRGRGRGRGRGMGRGRGRGRGRGGGSAGQRSSTRLSSRADDAGGGGGGAGRLKLSLSLKVSGAGGGGLGGGGRPTSFLGDYDRELDENPDEPLAFEEQFVLRVPRELVEGRDGLRELIRAKRGLDGTEFKFLDSRRAAFRHHGSTYAAKLVDLPNIVESQKTLDSRHLFKVADISQMLVVTDRVASEAQITAAPLRVDDYIWPHGLTPPLRHVRKRRFRKRISRRAIEVVEEQVEELVRKDNEAEESTFDLIYAHPDPDAPDSYYANWSAEDPYSGWPDNASEFGGSEAYHDGGLGGEEGWDDYGEEGGEEGDEDEEGDDVDADLQAALMQHMERSDESGSEDESASDDDDDDGDGGSDEDDDETAARRAKVRQYASEIKQLEGLIERKRGAFQGGNPIIVKRHEETIAGLQADVNTKIAARQALQDELDASARVAEPQAADAASAGGRAAGDDGDDGAARGTGLSTPFDGPGALDGDGDGEAGQTPGAAVGGTPAGDSDDEDLFGDDDGDGEAEDEGEDAGGASGRRGSEAGGAGGDADAVAGGSDDIEMGDDDMVDMAALLEAELGKDDAGGDGAGGGDAGGGSDDVGGGQDADMAVLEGIEVGTPGQQQAALAPGPGGAAAAAAAAAEYARFSGVEGGVGMRRLASGVAGDEDSDDSSEDSDE